METACPLVWAIGTKPVCSRARRPHPRQQSVQTLLRNAETKGTAGDAWAGILVLPSTSLPDDAGTVSTPATSLGHVDLSLLGREKAGSPAAQLLQGDLLSPPPRFTANWPGRGGCRKT